MDSSRNSGRSATRVGAASEAAGKGGPGAVGSATATSGGEPGRHGRRRRRSSWKHKRSNKLVYSPFLRMLVLKPGFRLAVIAFALLLCFLALFLPTIWTMSPKGFLPILKVSELDLAQAWLAKRGARRAQPQAGTRKQFGGGRELPESKSRLSGLQRWQVRSPGRAPEQFQDCA
jgi:hypothetical protein